MVRTILGRLRAVATEIVVAVDRTAGWTARDTELVAGTADRIVPHTYQFPPERNFRWLHDQCTSDWILRLDGDEVPSQALVERLGTPGWDAGVTHLLIPRRWVWPAPTLMLDASPWWPDPQLRLVRRGLVRLSDTLHQPAEIAGCGRWLDAPIYHLDLLNNTPEKRLTKARRYEASNPGLRTEAGTAQNTGFYVPEAIPGPLRTIDVPVEDREVVAASLAVPARTDLGSVGARTLPPAGTRTATVVHPGPSPWTASATARVMVRVANPTDTAIASGLEPPVRVGARIRSLDGAIWGEFRAELTCPILPGTDEVMPLTVDTPPAGAYTLEVGLLVEGSHWFEPLDVVPVACARQPTIVVSAGISPHRHLGDDLILRATLEGLAIDLPTHRPIVATNDPVDATARFGAPAIHDGGSSVYRRSPIRLRRVLAGFVGLERDLRRVRRGRPARDSSNRALLDAMGSTDALVILGAGWLTSKYRIHQMIPKLAEARAARGLGVPVLLEATTIGPFTSRLDRLLARALLRTTSYVSVRDGQPSIREAVALGVRPEHISEVADAATAPAPADRAAVDRWLRSLGVDPAAGWAVVSVRDPRDLAASRDDARRMTANVAATVNMCNAEGLAAIFIPHCVGGGLDDQLAGREIATSCGLVVPDELPSDHVMRDVIRDARVVVGNRFHVAVIADGAGVPGVFVATSAFDDRRSGAFKGRNIETVGRAEDLPEAFGRALHRPPRPSAITWSSADLVQRLRRLTSASP